MKVTIADKPLKPGEQQIDSGNCCGQCLYNVPQGTFMMLLPGFMCLVIGVILFFTDSGDTWRNGMIKADIIFMALGTVLLSSGAIYYSTQWCRVRKRKPKEYGGHGEHAPAWVSSSTVQLVGMYRIAGPDDQYPDDTMGSQTTAGILGNPNETLT